MQILQNIESDLKYKMGRNCIVKACKNRKGKPDSPVHLFPHRQNRKSLRELWIKLAVELEERESIMDKLDNYGVCSKHLRPSDYKDFESNNGKRGLKDGSIPQIQLCNSLIKDTLGTNYDHSCICITYYLLK